MSELVDEFVFVRLIKANDLDLTLFQFDYDLTFSVFFMNADKTIYGRYGTRSSVDDAEKHMSRAGLARAMQAALKLHEGYPANKPVLAGKQPVKTTYPRPDAYPSLKGRYKKELDYEGKVAVSCLHCHQVRDAARQVYRDAGKPIPDKLLFPQPLPSTIGLTLDPDSRATVSAVAKDTIAQYSGFERGDELLTLGGQAVISIADVQWVLHHAEAPASLSALVRRGDKLQRLEVELPEQWRRETDISWRVTSWALRRMVTGGLLFEPTTPEQRADAGVKPLSLALRVKHVGQYGAHAAAKRAGFRVGDVVISFDGKREPWTTSQLLGYASQATRPGQRIPVVVMRNGQRLELQLPMQK